MIALAAVKYSPDEPRNERGEWTAGTDAPANPDTSETNADSLAWGTAGVATAGGDPANALTSFGGVGALTRDGPTDETTWSQRLRTQSAKRIAAASNGALDREDAGFLMSEWRASAASPSGLALQQATADKFRTPMTPYMQSLIDRQKAIDADTSFGPVDPNTWQNRVDNARAFVDAQYRVTQQWYKDHDITSVTLFRGQSFPNDAIPAGYADLPTTWDAVQTPESPLSSWSVDAHTAGAYFAYAGPNDTGYLKATTVPAAHVLANSITGLGNAGEGEHILIGGTYNESIKRMAA